MTAGVILTGGLSTRMGVDKATMPVAGKPMVVSVADALWEAGLHPVECQGGDRATIEQYGLTVEPDAAPGDGPLVAIHTALTRHDHRNIVVVACDLVDIDGATVRSIVDAVATNPSAAVAAASVDGRFHMVSWWRAGVGPRLEALLAEGIDAYQDALVRLDAIAVPVDPAAVRNVNSPDDLGPGE